MQINETARKQELLLRYLYNKATGGSDCGGIPEYNLYSEKEPWEIWEECNGGTQLTESSKELYVFTKVKKMTARAWRLERTVGTGLWKFSGPAISLSGNVNSDGNTMALVGKEKRFYYRSQTPHDHRWVMMEYSLDASILKHAKFQDYVLCQIKRVDKSENKKRLEKEEALGPRIINDKSMDSELEDTCNKIQEISLEGDKGKQPELSFNNDNNGTGPTTMTNTEEAVDIDTELLRRDGRAIIDLPTDDEEPDNDDAQVNNIGATPMEKQLPPLKSPLGESDWKESAAGDRNHWSYTLAKELLRGQEQPMEEPEIEMIPNLFYQGRTDCELLTKKWTSGQE